MKVDTTCPPSEAKLGFLEGQDPPPATRRLVAVERTGNEGGHRQAKMAHVRQSKPDSGLSFQKRVLQTLKSYPLGLEGVERTGNEGGHRRTNMWHTLDYQSRMLALASRKGSLIALSCALLARKR